MLTLTGNKIREIPKHVKSLRIVKSAVQEAGEEYWQDKEVDGLEDHLDPAKDDMAFESNHVDASNDKSQSRTVKFGVSEQSL